MAEIHAIPPAEYWRKSKSWSQKLGQTGTVIASTLIYHGLPELADSTPYWLVLIKHPDSTHQLYLGADGYSFQVGDKVKSVLRKLGSRDSGLINYGLKVIPISPAKTGKPKPKVAPATSGGR